MSSNPYELNADNLWCPCDPESLGFETTASLPAETVIIGQERAVRAIELGIGLASFGFNIYALGYTGTGRSTTVRTFLSRIATEQPVPVDWVYVNNFADMNRPRAISLPPGTATGFRRDMGEFVADLLRDIPRAFESEDYEKQKERIVLDIQEKRNAQFAELERGVSEQGFTLMKTAMGLGVAPVLNGQVLTPEAYERLDEGTRRAIETRQEQVQSVMAASMRSLRDLERSAKKSIEDFDRGIADFVVGQLMAELKEKYGQFEEIPDYLNQVHADVVASVEGFKDQEPPEGASTTTQAGERADLLKRYLVNVLVDNSQQKGAPVIVEANPTFGNLVGRIEHRAEFGALVTDFTMIKPGALHRANGGFLVAEVRGLLSNPLAWDALKRALKNRQIRPEEIEAQLQVVSTVTVEPEPIPLNVKVVLVGDPVSYYLFHEYDEDFRKLFKVQADFGTDFPRTPETCAEYSRFVAARCHEDGLPHFSRSAVARVIEHGSRLAEHQAKLSTRFGEIADLVREASYWARRRRQEAGVSSEVQITEREDVQRAIDEKAYRSNRADERIQEMIDDGTLRVDVEGKVVGQVNGLSVMALGDYSFGKPSRITVQTFTGRSGVVSLNREAKLSGRIYDKGLLTLTGYLGGKYAHSSSLSLSASISFEQLYEEVEGDSASSAELYALLSSLSGVPLNQAIAVTGSVDQQGHTQPVGGVNEKIEGYFETCRRRGLDGQGVILPVQNVVNLMLRADVRQAVEEGKFHIYPVGTIDEGLAILTGIPAGERQADGTYPAGTVHGRVAERLAHIAECLRGEGKHGPEEPEEKTPDEGAAPASSAETDGKQPDSQDN